MENHVADLEQAKSNPKEQMWEQLDDVHAGMLGVEGSGQHMQPMAPQNDPENGSIWFFTNRKSDLARSVKPGSRATFILIGEDHDYHACLDGTLSENRDQSKVDEYWSPIVAAWFEGKDDPDMTLLQLKLEKAAIWASSSSPVKFGWEIAKANMTDGEPDVGVTTHIRF